MITAITVSNNTVSIVIDNGKRLIVERSDHPKYNELIQAGYAGDEALVLKLSNLDRIVAEFSVGELSVTNAGVFYKGSPMNGIDAQRVMDFVKRKLNYAPIANYMVRKLANPSKRAITELYTFLENKFMPLTAEGKIIAYRGIRSDWYSVTSGSEPLLQGKRNEKGHIYNGIGETIEMNRSDVDDDFRVGCSGGLHAGALKYALEWATSHNGFVILVEIDPADVVSVPADCNFEKLRCSKYKVIGLYEGPLPSAYVEKKDEIPVTEPIADSSEKYDESTCFDCGETEEYCDCEDGFDARRVWTPILTKIDPVISPDVVPEPPCPKCGDSMQWCACPIPTDITDIIDPPVNPMYLDGSNNWAKIHDNHVDARPVVTNSSMAEEMGFPPGAIPPGALSEADLKMIKDVHKITHNIHPQYHDGWRAGRIDGRARNKRQHFESEEGSYVTESGNQYCKGYNTGYRFSRKDYKKNP